MRTIDWTFNYSFQGAGGVVQNLSLPNGSYITNVHDSVMRLTSTTLFSSSNQVLNSHSYGYNPLNQRTNTVRVDGSYAQYAYDLAGQLIKASGFESNGTARLHEKFGYAYDSAENLSYRTNNALVKTFTVNALNGLTNVTRNATNALTVAGTTTITATNVTVNGSMANLYADNTFAREGFTPLDGNNAFTAIAQDAYGGSDSNSIVVNLPLSTTFQYDLNGNMTNDSVHVLDYDDENQLVTNTVAGSWKSEFVYDGKMRRRIRREYSWQGGTWVKTNEVRYVYEGNLVLQERDSNNSGTMTYTRGLDMSGSIQGAGGIGGLLALSQPSALDSQPAYYHADGNGNVTALVNQRQEVVARYLYDPFGNTLLAAGPMAEVNFYRFSSKETHLNSGLIYFLYRYFDSPEQRWLNRDPIAEQGGINLYGFGFNSPINVIDFLGLDPGDIGIPRPRSDRAKQNCMGYALCNPDLWGQGTNRSKDNPWPEERYLKEKGCREIGCDDSCDPGQKLHKVKLYEWKNADQFHIVRQDGDYWSAKDRGGLIYDFVDPDRHTSELYKIKPDAWKATCWCCPCLK